MRLGVVHKDNLKAMSVSAAFEWLQADERRRRLSIKITTTAILSLLCGFLGSVGLGYMAVEYNIVANDSVATDADKRKIYIDGVFTRYLPCGYDTCRTWVKGPEELYNQ